MHQMEFHTKEGRHRAPERQHSRTTVTGVAQKWGGFPAWQPLIPVLEVGPQELEKKHLSLLGSLQCQFLFQTATFGCGGGGFCGYSRASLWAIFFLHDVSVHADLRCGLSGFYYTVYCPRIMCSAANWELWAGRISLPSLHVVQVRQLAEAVCS